MESCDALPYALSAMSIDDRAKGGASEGGNSNVNDEASQQQHQLQRPPQQDMGHNQQQHMGDMGNMDEGDSSSMNMPSEMDMNMTISQILDSLSEDQLAALQQLDPESQQRALEELLLQHHQKMQELEQQQMQEFQQQQMASPEQQHQQMMMMSQQQMLAAQDEPQQPLLSPEELQQLQEMQRMGQLSPEQQQILEKITQQQQQLHQESMDDERPEEHFLTIALNGTILGATEMATGFPPANLLMTSAFDSVHEDDLLGMHAIKTHFWERDQPDVEVYLRRRNVEGDWIWLVAKVVSYIDSPVPGIIIHEALVMNEDVAVLVSRITRIASLLLQSVESSFFGSEIEASSGEENVDTGGAAETQAMLLEAAEKMGVDLSSSDNPLRELMEAAANGYAMGGSEAAPLTGQGETDRRSKKNEDPLDFLKTGATLDLSKIILTEGEVKLVTLVLTGRLQIEDLGPLLYLALNSPEMDLVAATDEFYSLSEQQLAANATARSPSEIVHLKPPPLAVINLSFTDIGDFGMETLSEFIYSDNGLLKTLDLGFCNISNHGLLSLCKGLKKRHTRGLPSLQGLVLSGNTINREVAKHLGVALSSEPVSNKRGRDGRRRSRDLLADEEEETQQNPFAQNVNGASQPSHKGKDGIKLLHLGSTSIKPESLVDVLSGLGPNCPLQELKVQSNGIDATGASCIVSFLEGKSENGQSVLPKMNRLDLSYNKLGDNGITKLTRAISKRTKVNMTDVSLSGNDMGSKGIESIMNKLLQHKLVTLNLDNNSIGDQGCQLVAASLPSIGTLSRLNLAFNDIGCRGIATLMRSLVGCESITSLGLSGNVMKISGAIAMGFTLAQHPRLSELELDNCCLSQVAQCHIVAGIISNRWVPMKVMHGFRAGPPMVAIGALEIVAQHLTNEECFRLRRDIQMKTLLQWMESNRTANTDESNLLTNEVISGAHELAGAPSQNAYVRMLDWLGRIPFDESELMDLRKYFYDVSGSDGEVKSDMNLKHRGDILAALASDVVEEILESDQVVFYEGDTSIGLDLDKVDGSSTEDNTTEESSAMHDEDKNISPEERGVMTGKSIELRGNRKDKGSNMENGDSSGMDVGREPSKNDSSVSTLSASMVRSESQKSTVSQTGSKISDIPLKARITMFPQFATKLDNLKAVAQEMMDHEDDPVQQDVIAQQFAEASLTILRQLRYHCMESGLDGWRQGKLRRKVLIVDDSVVTRKMVARAFEKANFIVDTAENGVEGVNKMKESIYDIAFMDIDMPVMNGFDATKALRMWEDSVRPGARQPICALTAAHVDDFDRSELMKFKDAGLDVMESKPCNIPRLFKVVDDVSPMFSDLSINAIQISENEDFGM